jgi:hypothetical protein
MRTQRRFISIATCGLFLVALSATRFVAGSHAPPSARSGPVTCALLTTKDATTALEVPSQPGKEFIDSTGCIWSNDPNASDSSRRVTLNMHSLRSFQIAKNAAVTTIKIEPVPGIGDEAFYQIYPKDQSPFIWVRKGNSTFDIRILTQLKPKPFTVEQEKSKEAVLAKAAVAKL